MPEWARARTGKESDPVLKAYFDALKKKLFGAKDDVA